uniref:Uncharacterized protein n=1 Tax=Heterorhabditis bacteriophora TaxID=37862 RepID=A0A1I7WCR4_HETBA
MGASVFGETSSSPTSQRYVFMHFDTKLKNFQERIFLSRKYRLSALLPPYLCEDRRINLLGKTTMATL